MRARGLCYKHAQISRMTARSPLYKRIILFHNPPHAATQACSPLYKRVIHFNTPHHHKPHAHKPLSIARSRPVTAIATYRAHESLRAAHLTPKISLVLCHPRLLAQGRVRAPRRRSRLLRAQIRNILVVRLRIACHSRGGSSGAHAPSSIKKIRIETTVQHLVQYRARGVATTASARNPTAPVAACLVTMRARGLH